LQAGRPSFLLPNRQITVTATVSMPQHQANSTHPPQLPTRQQVTVLSRLPLQWLSR